MKAIILAAGMGTRLKPYTLSKPKALVEIDGKPIIDYQIDILRTCGINNISIVAGYKAENFKGYDCQVLINENYESSNMIYSLFETSNIADSEEDVLICYGDIIYSEDVLHKMILSDAPLTVSADLDWLSLWQKRMENPLSDAESFIYGEDLKLLELGKQAFSVDDAQAQFIGLIKCNFEYLSRFVSFYHSLDSSISRNMYMTDFLQLISDADNSVYASLHSGEWLEVDTVSDLIMYQDNNYLNKNVLIPHIGIK